MEDDKDESRVKRQRTLKKTSRVKTLYGINVNDHEWMETIPECPEFRPSLQDFEDPLAFLQTISSQVSKYGICKIVSPLNNFAPVGLILNRRLKNFKFEPILQTLAYSTWKTVEDKISYYKRGRSYKYSEFERVANSEYAQRYESVAALPPNFIEREFWDEMGSNSDDDTVEYGVNVEGSAFSTEFDDELGNSEWNLKKFPRQPLSVLRLLQKQIPGITEPMLYIGSLFSTFAWHVEDHYLYSLNYHHSGAPKTWYGVPSGEARKFERVTYDHVYSVDILPSYDPDGAAHLLSEKTTMLPPSLFLKHGVPVYRALQMPGDFVITFPRAYHAGFSHGFNCAEAVNFAVGDWFPYGSIASKRYSLLDQLPVIPFEELLCKEAILLFQRMSSGNFKPSSEDLIARRSIMSLCISLVENYQILLRKLRDQGMLKMPWKSTLGSVYCGYCKKDRYLGYVMCNNCKDPRCLSHEIKSNNCSMCREKIRVFMNEDMDAVEAAATRFEGERECLSGYLKDTPELQEEFQELLVYEGVGGGEASTSNERDD